MAPLGGRNTEHVPYEPEMVTIPAGAFLIGSKTTNLLRSMDEPGLTEVDLPYSYATAVHPVTVSHYRYFVVAGGYTERRFWTEEGWRVSAGRAQPDHWDDPLWAGDEQLPVIGVSWYEAHAYSRWLAEASGRAYRLPTEAEWEKAARGGLWLPEGESGRSENPCPTREWPWGDDEPDDARLNFGNTLGHTTPVGSYPDGASPYGALDMAGNVWEWMASRWAHPYAFPEDTDPQRGRRSGRTRRLVV